MGKGGREGGRERKRDPSQSSGTAGHHFCDVIERRVT